MPAGYNQAFATYLFGPIDIALKDIKYINMVHFSMSPVSELSPEEMIKAVKDDIKKNGLLNPIEVDWNIKEGESELVIGIGGTRYIAAKELGWKKIPCYLRVHLYKFGKHPSGDGTISEDIIKVLKKILPFIGYKSGDYYGRTIPNKEWIARRKKK